MNRTRTPAREAEVPPIDALPAHWEWRTVGELASNEAGAITDGPFGSKLKTEHYTRSGPRVIRLQNIGEAEFVDASAHISEEHFATLQRHAVAPGDLVIAALGETFPRACLIPGFLGPAIVKADCIRFRPSREHSPKYLNFALNWEGTRKRMAAIVHGVGRPRLNLAEVKLIRLPIAPPDEQTRIVAEIEKQFTRLDAGVAALRRAQANLKRYRASVLKAACEGRLVPTEADLARAQGRPYETGAELLARILIERRTKRSGRRKYKEPVMRVNDGRATLPEGWTWASLDHLAWSSGYGTSVKCSYENTGAPVLRIPNVERGRLDLTDLKFADKNAALDADDAVAPGDLLVIRTNGSRNLIGRSALVCETLARSTSYASYLIRFRLCGDASLHRWVGALWDCPTLRAWIEQRAATSAGQHNISMSVLGSAPIAFPPLAEQARIVAEVDRRLSVLDELETLVTANLQRATRLRQSILQRAFAGELVRR